MPDPMNVQLREITADTVLAVLDLQVAPAQQRLVAPNAQSLAQALFSPEAWYRAAWRGDELVGFVMVADETLRDPPPAKPTIGLWRLMVDGRFQGQGIGKAMVLQVAEMARARGFDRLYTSYLPGEASPEGFYRGLGFVPTGELDGDEIIAALPLPLTRSD